MPDSDNPDIFQCTIILNGAVQRITIETGLDNEEKPYYKAFMPDGRILSLQLNTDDLLWYLDSGEVTEESETIGDCIIEHYH